VVDDAEIRLLAGELVVGHLDDEPQVTPLAFDPSGNPVCHRPLLLRCKEVIGNSVDEALAEHVRAQGGAGRNQHGACAPRNDSIKVLRTGEIPTRSAG
jgi:hypothetical protein